jgi:hypothetical protein
MAENADDLPASVVETAERLTRLARSAVDDNEAAAYRERRTELLDEHGYTARVREEDRETLVLYPTAWVVDGTVYPNRIDDVDRGIERPLEGPGTAEDWDTVEAHNRGVAERVAEEHGDEHGRNAHALADFASNHYAKPVERLTDAERTEFVEDYFPRNAFASAAQAAVVEESVHMTLQAAEDAGRSGEDADPDRDLDPDATGAAR